MRAPVTLRRLMLVATGILAVSGIPRVTHAQQVTVSGLVIERSQSSWIGGATVRLSGSPPHFTELDGTFRFAGVVAGHHTLTVQAMGYHARSLELEIGSDTTLTIEMDPDPILLDSLLVRAATIKIRGQIRDAQTGRQVLHAQVTVLPGFPTTGAISGSFTVPDVPAGRAVMVLVEAVEYLPARIALITEADTTLTVELEPDSVGIRLMEQRLERLDVRSNSLPFRKMVIDGEDMALTPFMNVYDMIRTRLQGQGLRFSERLDANVEWPCLIIDEVEVRYPAYLWGLTSAEVERVEVFGKGSMVRVYTKRFLIGRLGKASSLSPLLMGICR